MVFPLIPVAVGVAGVGGGIVGGYLTSLLGSGGKKDYSEHHAPKEHYAPVTTDARATSTVWSPSYIYQIQSPEGYISKKDTNVAESTAIPKVSSVREDPSTISEGADMSKLAIIGVVGLVAYGLVSKK